ncbi:ricin B lectin domain-containing protein [Pterulicium gracile]|uniref:Ricin B lectin domain-containing protein n=1 Tax=Pterulicium gracile TaxID=1884261 RepID=A0A5C3Q635_9AGAR|nr:ricin B lectin domain-containing protein [Pterula gracilis]
MQLVALLLASIPAISALSINLDARQTTAYEYHNIHPNGDKSKCISVLGGKIVIGAAIDIYDCNGSAGQKWSWSLPGLFTTNPTTGQNICMDLNITDWSQIKDGTGVVLKRCELPGSEDGIPTQAWGQPQAWNFNTIGQSISSNTSGNMCLDLTGGSKANQNPLQIWRCSDDKTKPRKNQIWTLTKV